MLSFKSEGVNNILNLLFGLLFMFSNFYQLESHNELGVALTNLRWSIN